MAIRPNPTFFYDSCRPKGPSMPDVIDLLPQPLRVLIADDNRDAADSLALLVRTWGHDIRVCYDGSAALETARTFGPGAMVLDLGMPGLTGYQIAELAREDPKLRLAALIAVSG